MFSIHSSVSLLGEFDNFSCVLFRMLLPQLKNVMNEKLL